MEGPDASSINIAGICMELLPRMLSSLPSSPLHVNGLNGRSYEEAALFGHDQFVCF